MPEAMVQVMCQSSAKLLFETFLIEVIGTVLCALWRLYTATVY